VSTFVDGEIGVGDRLALSVMREAGFGSEPEAAGFLSAR
jgi:hypothetical protein